MNETDFIWNFKESMLFFFRNVMLKEAGYTKTTSKSLGTVSIGTSYTLTDCDISYFDDGSISESILVKSGTDIIDNSYYSVNYYNKSISFTKKYSNIVVTFEEFTVKIIDAFPESSSDISSFSNSIVSFDIDKVSMSDFAIGVQPVFWKFNCFVDIFATTDNIRLRLTNMFMSYLKKVDIRFIDFSKGLPFNNNGTLNTSFDYDLQKYSLIRDNGNPSNDYSDVGSFDKIKRYRSGLSFVSTIVF